MAWFAANRPASKPASQPASYEYLGEVGPTAWARADDGRLPIGTGTEWRARDIPSTASDCYPVRT